MALRKANRPVQNHASLRLAIALNKEIPPILGPGIQNPANYSPLLPDYDFVDPYETHVVQGHFWNRIKATHVPYGDGVFARGKTMEYLFSRPMSANIPIKTR